jgi:hypothetical protein
MMGLMVRAVGFAGLIAAFLSISGKFRGSAWGLIAGSIAILDEFSPLSYIALTGGIVIGFLVYVRTGSTPR